MMPRSAKPRRVVGRKPHRSFRARILAIEALEDRLCLSPVLLVSDDYNNRILAYDGTTGALQRVFASGGGLMNAHTLVYGPDGNLYVASDGTNSVVRYDGTTGAPLPAPGQTGAFFVASGSGGLLEPIGITFGPDGNLYVDSRDNSNVLKYDGRTGAFLGQFVAPGSGSLNGPNGLTFGPDGNLYVASAFSDNVLRYNGTMGAFMGAFGSPVSNPYGLTFGPDNNLYVASAHGYSVERFNGMTGAPLPAPGQTGSTFVTSHSGGLDDPVGLGFGPDGNLFVSSASTHNVLRYNGTTGNFIGPFASGGGLDFPTFLAFTNVGFDVTGFPTIEDGGVADTFTVTARNANGTIDTTYTGRVRFSSNDPQAVLPADYTFTPDDHGVQSFSATLKTAGSRILSVNDTSQPSRTGNEANITVLPVAADHYGILMPSSTVAGTPMEVTVTALDPYGNTAISYRGTVNFTSSNPQATLPVDYHYRAIDQGTHRFTVSLRTSGNQPVTATDTATASITGTALVAVTPAAADHFVISVSGSVSPGTPFDVTVTVVDAYGNTVPTYLGMVHFSSTDRDPGVLLPPDYTFQASDNGSHLFAAGVTLITPGDETLMVTDIGSGLSGSITVHL
jgi:DNA-binding beta-propeller fold protein YncE